MQVKLNVIVAAAASVQSTSGEGSSTIAGGRAVRLRDIATVRQGYKEREAVIRAGGHEAVELAIYKEGDANTVAVAEAIKVALERLKDQLPQGATLTTIEDQSIFIEAALSEVKKEALMGGVFAILLIFFFLRDGWSTFVIGLSLPVSIIATFFFMDQFGLNLNVMSLAGLALATGMVVDDSIVVLESIAKARERGLGVLEAAIKGTQEVAMAVVHDEYGHFEGIVTPVDLLTAIVGNFASDSDDGDLPSIVEREDGSLLVFENDWIALKHPEARVGFAADPAVLGF